MSKKTKTPEAPNYAGLATQQQAANEQAWNKTLQANRPNQSNQFGSSTWEQDPATGQWTQSTQLNQPQQDIFNQQQANQQQIANMGGGLLGSFDASQVDLSGAPAMGQVGQFNQQATDLYIQLAQPQLERQRAAKEAQMAAMGLGLGSGRAYDTQQELLNESENRSAMMGAQAGIQQGNTMFGQQNQLHQQGVQDILNQKQANLEQLAGLFGLGQAQGVPTFQNFGQAGQLTAPNISGAAQNQYEADLTKTNAANADKSNTTNTIGTVASIAAVAF